MKKYVCSICGYIYDEEVGIPQNGIKPKTRWQDLPDDWVCPLCGASKSEFSELKQEAAEQKKAKPVREEPHAKTDKKLSYAEMSVLCSNLAKGCEKQYLAEESKLFSELAEYFDKNSQAAKEKEMKDLSELIENDINKNFINANTLAKENFDRGALRALTWSEKVTKIVNSLVNRYQKEGVKFLENTNIYVCEICGFIYVGDEAPEICPVCKVPKLKIHKIERRA